MIRKVYEVNPLTCPKCQAEMRIIAFITDYAVVDRIINHIADIRGGETSSASRRLATIRLGFRGLCRLFFMIFSLMRQTSGWVLAF